MTPWPFPRQVWVSTFRSGNAGLHLLDYDTGVLQYSLHGFTECARGPYTPKRARAS